MPGQHELEIYQGDVYVLPFQLSRRVDGELEPLDITDYAIFASIRRNEKATEDIATFTGAVTVAAEGKLELTLSHEESMKLTRDAVWDFATRAPGGTVKTWLYGPVSVKRRVTDVPSD